MSNLLRIKQVYFRNEYQTQACHKDIYFIYKITDLTPKIDLSPKIVNVGSPLIKQLF